MENKKIPVIIDTDPGIDDAASLFWVLSNERFDIKALTITNGNIGLDGCVNNALRILEVSARTEIPVYRGSYRPIMKKPMDASWIHGSDGLGDAGLPEPSISETPGYAPAEMARIIARSEEPVTILALAPLTNVALALLLDRNIHKNIKQILFMGGAVNVIGNDSPVSSFNVAVDPEAASIVYKSGVPLVQLGLDVCDQFTETDADFENLRENGGKIGKYLYKMTSAVRARKDLREPSRWFKTRPDGIGLNDIAATAYLINPDWFKVEKVYAEIETGDRAGAGQTIVDFRRLLKKEPNILFAYEADSQKAVARWVSDIISYSNRL